MHRFRRRKSWIIITISCIVILIVAIGTYMLPFLGFVPGRTVVWSTKFDYPFLLTAENGVLLDRDWQHVYLLDNEKNITCISADGSRVWHTDTPFGAPIDPAMVISSANDVLLAGGKVRAARIGSDGSQLWYFDSKVYQRTADQFIPANGPAELAVYDEKSIYGLDLAGNVVWVNKEFHPQSMTRILKKGNAGEFYFESWEGEFVVLNSDGSVKWQYELEHGSIGLDCAIAYDGAFYILDIETNPKCGHTVKSALKRLDADGHLVWETEEVFSGDTSPVVCRNLIFVALDWQGMAAYSFDGDAIWQKRELPYFDNLVADYIAGIVWGLSYDSFVEINAEKNSIVMRKLPRNCYVIFVGGPDGRTIERTRDGRLLMTQWTY